MCGDDIYGFSLIIVSDFHIKVSIVLYEVNRMLQLQLCLHMCVCCASEFHMCVRLYIYMYGETVKFNEYPLVTKSYTHTHTYMHTHRPPIVHFILTSNQTKQFCYRHRKIHNEVNKDVLQCVYNELYKYVPCRVSYFHTGMSSCYMRHF